MRCARNIFLFLSLICLVMAKAMPAWAGPWAMPKGEGQIISSGRYSQANNLLQDMGEDATSVQFSKYDSKVYWEHGVNSKLTFVASSTFQTVDYMASTGREVYTGFGDTQIGARYQLYQTDHMVFAIQPSYIFSGNGENIADADLGDAGNALELRLLMGGAMKWTGRSVFFDAQLAAKFRQNRDPTSYKVELTGGIDLTRRGQILIQGFHD